MLTRIKMFLEETDAGLLFLCAPIMLGLGIGIYFALPFEPSMLACILLALCACAGLLLARYHEHRALSIASYLVFLILLGVNLATYRSAALSTHMLDKDVRFTVLEARILDLSPQEGGKGAKLIVAPLKLEKFEKGAEPQKIALSVRDAQNLEVGQVIRAKASLKAPSGPFTPGGFSFRRYNYFQGIGAQGFTFGAPEVIAPSKAGGVSLALTSLRAQITGEVLAQVDAPQNGITAALLTGQRGGIEDEIYDAMRAAGLAHMLAISGLHVGLFAGTVFFLLRLILAALPNVALHFEVKKCAAFAAIFAALIYTLFVGANIPALRALVTTALIFTAIIVDRSPISLRLVALAALLILCIQPEALVSAGFQMSFGAVTALVLFYDRLRPWLSKTYAHAGLMRKAGLYLGGVAITSLVASLATAPFALYHFQTLPLYGLAANLAAMPILSFWVMPCAVLTFALLPFGLEAYPLHAMGAGVSLIIDVATDVSSWPHAVWHVAQMPLLCLFLMMGAVFSFLTIRSMGLRIGVSAALIGATIVTAMLTPLPSLLISKDGEYAALNANGVLYVSNPRSERFTREQWQRALNIDEVQSFPEKACLQNGQLCCDDTACRFENGGKSLSWLKNRYGVAEDCADIHVQALIAPFGLPQFVCPSKSLYSRYKLQENSGLAAFDAQNGWKIVPVDNSVGKRPWSLFYKDFLESAAIHKGDFQ